MAHNILLTSLCTPGEDEQVHYFYGKNGYKNMYCDAMLTVEASCKYVLAKYPVDEIITLGRKLTFDEGDDGRLIELREGKNFYTADIRDLSTYSLFRYRIAQYIDELKIEQQDLGLLLDGEAQKKVITFIRSYYKKHGIQETDSKYNRFFDSLTKNIGLFNEFKKELVQAVPEAENDMVRYMHWIKNYLYSVLKESYKLEILPDNENVQVRFIPTNLMDDGKLPIDNILQLVSAITDNRTEPINLYVALNSDDMTDNFVLMSVLDIIHTMPDNNVNICNVFTTSGTHDMLAGEIRDDTEGYGITNLNAAFRAFLKYGKADMIIDYWEHCGEKNEKIDLMIYAMQHIDAGVSLCDVKEIEQGVTQLRKVFENGIDFEADSYNSRLFTVLAQGIRRDYGSLLKGEETDPFELARWAYEKGFYQQALTLIESRIPETFVERGIFYYAGNEEQKAEALRHFARYRNTLKPFELWKIDEGLEHFFIKSYNRSDPAARSGKGGGQRAYAAYRIKSLDNPDPSKMMTGYTVCTDREALENLLYAYYHIGEIRNITNHASVDEKDERLMVDIDDVSARMATIREAMDYFLKCYDTVMENMPEEKPQVVRITIAELRNKCKEMKNN